MLDVIGGIRDGYHPRYSVSSALSSWVDLNGDGVTEFIATPAWIERFSIEFGCRYKQSIAGVLDPGQIGERDVQTASSGRRSTGYAVDTDWHLGTLNSAGQLSLTRKAGPRGTIGLPLSYEVSVGAPVSYEPGVTLPIGDLVMTGVSSIWSGWMGAVAAAPGHVISTFTPRGSLGGTVSLSPPSLAGNAQVLGNVVAKGWQNSSIGGFIESGFRFNYDLTLRSTKTSNRIESRAQLMDINSDGLPDYLLYNNGEHASGDPLSGVSRGELIAFLQTPDGFAAARPVVVNTGFDYLSAPPAPGPIEKILDDDGIGAVSEPEDEQLRLQAALLTSLIQGQLDFQCYTPPHNCFPYVHHLRNIISGTDKILMQPGLQPFMRASTDALARERAQLDEILVLRVLLAEMAGSPGLAPDGTIMLRQLATLAGVPGPTFLEIDSTTWAANTLVKELGHLARTVRQIGHGSRINIVSEGFSELDAADVGHPTADGISVQTRGFVDLNGDALPDYVITNGQQNGCPEPKRQWEVFWGTGTSSISQQRAFLAEQPDASGQPTPTCVTVPDTPNDIIARGYQTLPLSVDRVRMEAPKIDGGQEVLTRVSSYVSLNDFNRDGLPDIVMVADTVRCPTGKTWRIFLNNGIGFETGSPFCLAAPGGPAPAGVEPASTFDTDLNVSSPAVRTTDNYNYPTISRNRSDTHAALIDIDADGTPEAVRRVQIVQSDGTRRDGMLVWRRSISAQPQDLMVEDRAPQTGERILVEYRPAADFQWTDARPNGSAPQAGHSNLAGVAGHLVRSVTTEPLFGRPERRTRRGYDYKSPYFDAATRMFAGFASRSSFALDPVPDDPKAAQPITIASHGYDSVMVSQRSAQRPDGLPGVTHTRGTVYGSGAPITETLTSYTEFEPTTSTDGIGGLKSIYSVPSHTLTVEYPSGLAQGRIFDVGFDGRAPLLERVGGRQPLGPQSGSALDTLVATAAMPTEATGGAVRFGAGSLSLSQLQYATPHVGSVESATIELWLRPSTPTGDEVIAEQPGVYRLLIVRVGAAFRWQLDVGGTTLVASDDDVVPDRWQHVVATFSRDGGTIFVNGRSVGSGTRLSPALAAAGNLVIGCGDPAGGPPPECFAGEIGEFRVYPEFWSNPPRVTGSESYSYGNGCKYDDAQDRCQHSFGQVRRLLKQNDLATPDDDVVSEFEYEDRSAAHVFGLESSRAERVLNSDGSSGRYLGYTEHTYDGFGNETQLAQFDGAAEVAVRPVTTELRVRTNTEFGDPSCPGRMTKVTDPLGAVTETEWDPTCAFVLQATNALGHVSRASIYGVDYGLGTAPTQSGPLGTILLHGRYGQQAESIDPNGATTLSSYDEWGRPVAIWSPLDRRDRPGVRMEYEEALCELSPGFVAINNLSSAETPCTHAAAGTLRTPSRATTLVWDDQLRRCIDDHGNKVSCRDSSATQFAEETPTGDYRASYVFGDGQTHAQSVDQGRPAWTVSGVGDFDALSRQHRSYKVRFLPATCPRAGSWCDSTRIAGDPLRSDVAAAQTAFDDRGRVVRAYGPAWPTCPSAPSTVVLVSGRPTSQIACDAAGHAPSVNDVTKFDYPAPGDTRTTNGKDVPILVRSDARGLVTLFQEYTLSPSSPSRQAYPYSASIFSYDRLGRLSATTDENGNTASNSYDALSRIIATDEPNLGRTTYEYDLASQLRARIVASGEKTVHEYDKLGRVTQTDYQRPRTVIAPPGSSGFVPAEGEPWQPPELCYSVPGFEEPSRFTPHLEPLPSGPLDVLPLVEGNLDNGAAIVSLPFDVAIATSELSPDQAAAGDSLRFEHGRYEFPEGSALRVSTDGSVGLQARGSEAVGVADVLSVDLQLKDGGLRSGVIEESGARSLIIEWEGTVAARDEKVLVRLILSERSPTIRYDYLSGPRVLEARVGLHLEGAGLRFERSFDGPVVFGQGIGFGEDAGWPGFRLICSRPPAGGIAIPMRAEPQIGPQVQLRYRVYSDDIGKVLVGYRDPADPENTHPLAVAHTTSRRIEESGSFDAAEPDVFDIALPDHLGGKDFTLVLEPGFSSSAASRGRFLLDLVRADVVATTYDTEERVHRTYDSSEPTNYIAADALGTRTAKRPLLDVTFDVPGVPIDRSPSRVEFTQASCGASVQPLQSVVGASGRGFAISANTECVGTVSQAPFSVLSDFTAELWLRPQCDVQQQTCPERTVFSVGQVFSFAMLQDGRVQCKVGSGTAESADPLPADAWTHVALTYRGNSLAGCTVNGVQQNAQHLPVSAPISGSRSFTTIRLGDASSVAGPPIEVDEVRLVPEARSIEEVLEDALRPLSPGPPRGNLVHIDFAHPSPQSSAVHLDQSEARNDALVSGGRITPGILGMVFDTRSTRPTSSGLNPPAPTGQGRITHRSTLELASAVTAELWLKTTSTQNGPALLLGKWDGELAPGWRLQMTPQGQLRWEVVTHYTPVVGNPRLQRAVYITRETVNDLQWHHVAATYDGQRLRVFKDGLPLHRWCGSGPREGEQPDPEVPDCRDPPAPSDCTVEVTTVVSDRPGGGRIRQTFGDAECIEGTIGNEQDVLIANDGESILDGFVDEVRISNYPKREFEIAASAALSSAFTQTLGREATLHNRFIWLDNKQVGPDSNAAPYDLKFEPARERWNSDTQGRLVSRIKHVVGQQSSADYFLSRAASDSLGRRGSIEYPHGEVVVSGFALDGGQTSLIGFGPQIGSTPSQSQVYVSELSATVTGSMASLVLGNGVRSNWTYEDQPVAAAAPTGAFGRDLLESALVTASSGQTLSDRRYGWDAVGNLEYQYDGHGLIAGATPYEVDYAYDALSRVVSAKISYPSTAQAPSAPAPFELFYDYDALGNLTLMDGADAAGTLRPNDGARQEYGRRVSAKCAAGSNSLPHAVTLRTAASTPSVNEICYDAAGRMTRSEDALRNSINTYVYFARGKPRSVTDRDGVSTYLYGGDGARVSKNEPSGTVQIVVDPLYREIGAASGSATFEGMYSVDGQTIARRVLSRANVSDPLVTAPTDLNWFNLDHLGSTYFLTDGQGQEVAGSRSFYRPFGGLVDAGNPPHLASGFSLT